MFFLFKVLQVSLSVILFSQQIAEAFVNIESLRQSRQEGWFGSTGVTSGGSSGNINVFRGGVASQNIYKTDHNEIIFSTRYDYAEASGNPIAHNGNAHLRYAQTLSPQLKWEIFTQVEFNEFQNLGLRTLNGGGLRWQIYKGIENSFFLGTGFYYEDEVVIDDEDQNNFRGNLYVSFRRMVSEIIEITMTGYYQPSHKTFLDYRVRLNVGIEFKVLESLSWSNEIRYFADTRPPAQTRKEDLFYNVGINLSY